MLYSYLISNMSYAKIDPLFYFRLNVESLYNRLQSLLCKMQTDEKGGQTYPINIIYKIIYIIFFSLPLHSIKHGRNNIYNHYSNSIFLKIKFISIICRIVLGIYIIYTVAYIKLY